jgi:hypothetical protein
MMLASAWPLPTQIFGWTLEELKGKQIPFLPEFERESTMVKK